MKRLLSLSALVSFMFIMSCNKDEDAAPSSCLPTSISGGLGDPEIVGVSFTYANNRLTTMNLSFDFLGFPIEIPFAVTYTGNNVTQLAAPQNAFVYVFSYDGSNRITRIENQIVDDGVTFAEREDYLYNASGQLNRINFSLSEDGSPITLENYTTYQYASTTATNPISSTEFSASGTAETTTTYEYDDKNNLFKNLPAFAYLFKVFGDNNETKRTETLPGTPGTLIVTTTYQYNEKGYPTTITVKEGSDPATSATVQYSCQ